MAFFILPDLTIYTSLSQDGAKLFSDPASDPVSGARKAGSEVANVSWQTSSHGKRVQSWRPHMASELRAHGPRAPRGSMANELRAGDRMASELRQASSEVTDT